MTQFVSAAAGVLLPVAVWAQDLGSDLSSGSPDTSAVNSGSSQNSSGIGGNSGSYSSGGTFSGNPSQSSSSQPGTFSGGIMVQDGAAYVIHRLQNEMSLPDGSKIEPNGTIRQSDGSTRSIGAGQILTMDGRVMSAPFNSGSSQSSSSGLYNSGSTPGASTSSGPSSSSGYQGSQSNSSTPSTNSSSLQGLGGSSSTSSDLNSNSLNNGSTTPTPADQSDGSGLAPGATSTDPAEDYTD